ncbi:hypothetical protein [Photobacterium kasasachensis]|uniref:hypothetical protein n=1 Tax=Photobacterium kasasachensis TaxID=2910240 RepID=UPI003D0A394B
MPAFKDSQFDYLFSAIANKYPAIGQSTDSTQFQFTGSPLAANWKTGADIDAYNTANKVAADVNGFYTPNPGSLYNAYSDLILSITPGIDNEKDPTYLNLINQRNIADDNYNAALTKATVAWQSYKQQNTNPKTGLPDETQSEWLSNPLGGLKYKDEYTKYLVQKDDLTSRISTLVESFNAALGNDQKKLTDVNNYSNYMAEDGKNVSKPTITIGGDLGKDVGNWSQQKNYDLDVTLDKNSTVTTPWKTVYNTKVEQHCFSTSVKTSVNTSRIIQDKHYKLRVMVKGFKSYPVTFGGWYSSSYVNPETAKFSPAATVDSNTFFGARSGSLHMIPSQIWVMYQPKIELTVSTETYKQTIEGALNSSVNWVSILTFRFDTSAGSSLAKVGDETTTITFDSPVLQGPQIFGVTSLKEILASSIEGAAEAQEEAVV